MVESDKQGSSGESPAGNRQTEQGGESLEARRRRLAADLATRGGKVEPREEGRERRQGYALAVKLSSEFIAAVLVGAFLGYLLDRFAGTAPWGMIVLLLLGFCAGVLNVLRSTGAVSTPAPGQRNSSWKAKPDDE
ncbi:AtpZ/AtpI family protein [Pseudohoeflea coraliihabitans]|uniref:ATP synthase protein I n=1 Tax=Pseudohoeflea coraliihabitans TaxID=2860393 RepID=A0ABS6WLY6_9HYPH|nr:AtpZ/AtpI family protein [Pseudohoeflea sp. DP4N28-3]